MNTSALTIYLKDYVSLPCEDAAPAIARAVADLKRLGASVLQFEAGVYPLKSAVAYQTDQSAHDRGAKHTETKDVYVLLDGLCDVHIRGVKDGEGNPLTVLAGGNDLEPNGILPCVLWVDHGQNITLENFKLTRDPEFACAARVTEVGGDTVIVEVLENNPCYDGMGTYCMNKFNADGDLEGESLSYGPGLPEKFRLIGDRCLSLKDEGICKRVAVGDIITFHQGSRTDFQCFFGNIQNLTLKNLHTVNSNGFAHLAFNVHNLTVENVKFKPEGNQYFTAPRDAFKLHKCHGNISVDNMYVEGVRMDGQNMHSNYIFMTEAVSENTVKFFSRYAYAPLAVRTDIEFYLADEMRLCRIKDYRCEGATVREGIFGYVYTVTFEGPVPKETTAETPCLARCWEPSLYTCRNSTFVNVAGAGHLSRIDHMRIYGCTYKNMMNPGILLGAEYPYHAEGGHATDVDIRECIFEGCGAVARYGAVGCIGIKSDGLPGKNNRNITIEDCTFRASAVGIDLHDACDVHIRGCRFEGIREKLRVDQETCGEIVFEEISIENAQNMK